MKILASGDDHFGDHERRSDCIRVHEFMVEVAEREAVDVFVSPGDMIDLPTSTPQVRRDVADFVQAMADVCPFLHAHGNHGNPRDMDLMRRLHTRFPVIVEHGAGVHRVAGAAIALMAWPERARLAAMYREACSAELDVAASDALRNVIRGLGYQMATHDGPRLLAGHFQVDGSKTSVGQPLIGHSMSVGLDDLALANVPLVLMSHLHLPQAWTHQGTEIVFCGSSFRTTYGETEEKSIVLAEYDGPRLVGWERIPTPCTPMELLEDEWDPSRGGWTNAKPWGDIRGAEVRFRYRVSSDQREAAKLQAEALKINALNLYGALAFKIEEVVIATGKARAIEVSRANTTGEKLLALWKARGSTPAEPRAAELLNMASELEVAS